ncbi:hypothetical protein J2749_001436 [Methanobacterium oryzae]
MDLDHLFKLICGIIFIIGSILLFYMQRNGPKHYSRLPLSILLVLGILIVISFIKTYF